eukprot:2770987-Prymnesium_polylepis.1
MGRKRSAPAGAPPPSTPCLALPSTQSRALQLPPFGLHVLIYVVHGQAWRGYCNTTHRGRIAHDTDR